MELARIENRGPKKFRHYLQGAHFEVRVLNDHRSLQTVKLSKVAANRVGRWNMLLSEFSMAISYLRGEDNHLSDQLSRAVQLPEEAWIKAGPGIDTDDKFEMPFAMAWPELYRQVVLASTRQELQLMHLLRLWRHCGPIAFTTATLCPVGASSPRFQLASWLARFAMGYACVH